MYERSQSSEHNERIIMLPPNEANKVQAQIETAPLRFRVDKTIYKELQAYAKQQGYLTGKLAKLIITSWVEAKVIRPRDEADFN
jgi:hypothetical protein